jgi:hypothetical protein
MNNIEFFNCFTLALLELLYSKFPVPTEINAMSVAASIIPEDTEYEAAFDLLANAHHAVTYLENEGYIEFKRLHYDTGTFSNVRLKNKGFVILNSTPDSLNPSESLIDRIKSALANGVTEGSKESFKELTKSLLGKAAIYASAHLPVIF